MCRTKMFITYNFITYSYRFSLEATSSKIVQEFYHWLPAHLVCVLLMVLRNIIVKFQNSQKSLFVKPYAGYFQCKSLYIITGNWCNLRNFVLLFIVLIKFRLSSLVQANTAITPVARSWSSQLFLFHIAYYTQHSNCGLNNMCFCYMDHTYAAWKHSV